MELAKKSLSGDVKCDKGGSPQSLVCSPWSGALKSSWCQSPSPPLVASSSSPLGGFFLGNCPIQSTACCSKAPDLLVPRRGYSLLSAFTSCGAGAEWKMLTQSAGLQSGGDRIQPPAGWERRKWNLVHSTGHWEASLL